MQEIKKEDADKVGGGLRLPSNPLPSPDPLTIPVPGPLPGPNPSPWPQFDEQLSNSNVA